MTSKYFNLFRRARAIKRPIGNVDIPPRLMESFITGYGQSFTPEARGKGAGRTSARAARTTDSLPPGLSQFISERLLARAQRESTQVAQLPDKVMENLILDEYLSILSDIGKLIKDRERVSSIIEELKNTARETVQVRLSDLAEGWNLVGLAPNLVELRFDAAGIFVGRHPSPPLAVSAFWSHSGQADSEDGVALPDDSDAAFVFPKSGKTPLWSGHPIRLIFDYRRRVSIAVEVLPG